MPIANKTLAWSAPLTIADLWQYSGSALKPNREGAFPLPGEPSLTVGLLPRLLFGLLGN